MAKTKSAKSEEHLRLKDANLKKVPWKKWGPYLSERQWGTVREDYSEDGSAWDYFPHDHARSRAYRWGEDGIAGISDEKQRLCFALTLWNQKDPILKERLFGLTNREANHGEDVKEYYYYIDNTPTHSYMKYLYKYPHKAYPYDEIVAINGKRSQKEPEYELIDTGVFNNNNYFDVFIEYAKESSEDILIRITVYNRGQQSAKLHVLPTIWFRNTWSVNHGRSKPNLKAVKPDTILATHQYLDDYYLYFDNPGDLMFTENETNTLRLWGYTGKNLFVKDAFHEYLIFGKSKAINPAKTGTKAAANYLIDVPAQGKSTIKLRLSTEITTDAFNNFDATFEKRIIEADEFYKIITPKNSTDDEKQIFRQALSGMLWSKQFYYFDLEEWLLEHKAHPLLNNFYSGKRNKEWFHMINSDVISMPDKWEYPWFAAWDLAFHTISLALVDLDFAKDQLLILLNSFYMHPNGQIPAYEWNFSDVNPPVHAWSALYLYEMEKDKGRRDIKFLEKVYHRLMLNFNWWINRKDPNGRNVFSGGFLGLDNIGVFDRSAELPTGGTLDQADGTAWMALYCQCMLEISLILCDHDTIYEEHAFGFMKHFLWISYAMDRIGDNQDELWDEKDGFFYDLLRLPDGSAQRLKVRSMVGLLPLCASEVFEADIFEKYPRLTKMINQFRTRHPNIISHVAPTDQGFIGYGNRRLLSILNKTKLERVLKYMLDENEFLGPYGLRSLSRYHLKNPFNIRFGEYNYMVQYLPGESDTGMFGGNSNWRGPVWMPVNILVIRGLLNLYKFYGDDFKVECPTGSGKFMTLYEVANEISNRLTGIFQRGNDGKRPVNGENKIFQDDPNWNNLLLFYEFFHGDNGKGLGASHQTGWTGLVAVLIDFFKKNDSDFVLNNTQSK